LCSNALVDLVQPHRWLLDEKWGLLLPVRVELGIIGTPVRRIEP